MAQIVEFEQEVIDEQELSFLNALKVHVGSRSYDDIRQFRWDVEQIMVNVGVRDNFQIGCGSSHVWIKRLNEAERWGIIKET